jgi:lipoprotein-anchoring transpeptidase ErfK/SrfK
MLSITRMLALLALIALPLAQASAEGLFQTRGKYDRQIVDFDTGEAPGTVIVETRKKFLYFVLGDGEAIRYGIGVGRQGFTWSGVNRVSRKAQWPAWNPPAAMRKRDPKLPVSMAGGPRNPLGARALYLGNTLFRIHGTNDARSIGRNVSSGCIRLLNANVIDLYNRVSIGAKVIVR